MKKKLLLSVMMFGLLLLCMSTANAGTSAKSNIKSDAGSNAVSNVEKTFKADFPDIVFDTIKKSPVKGLYEVTEGRRIYYFAPGEGILIAGQMFDKTKKNLTADRLQEITARADEVTARKAKVLPLNKAVKTGNGKHVVIEFTDPDCPFCRNAAKFFGSRTDVTKYTFFTPMPMHPDAPNKVRYILCQKDRSKAFDEVMKGKIDGQKYQTCTNAEVDELIKVHKSVGATLGVSGTPFFVIDGKVVNGADIPKIEKLLSEKVAVEKLGKKK
jgi:thiol:disulfide interchange protein DsbC